MDIPTKKKKNKYIVNIHMDFFYLIFIEFIHLFRIKKKKVKSKPSHNFHFMKMKIYLCNL